MPAEATTLLSVDDGSQLLQLWVRVFEGKGCQLLSASNAGGVFLHKPFSLDALYEAVAKD